MWKLWWAPNNASKWQMGFNSAFKGLTIYDAHSPFFMIGKFIGHFIIEVNILNHYSFHT
jgi:hypothetical protein